MAAITETEPVAPPPQRTGSLRILLDPLLGLCALALIGFPVVCALLAARAPLDPRPQPRSRPFAAQGPVVRTLPVVAAQPSLDDPAAVRALVEAEIDRVYAPRDAARLRRYVNTRQLLPAARGTAPDAYPYRYQGLDALVARTPLAGELGGLLIIGAAANAYPNASQVAFALLHRARGTCTGQLNLAFLVTASADPSMGERELRAAGRACPGDPTATWLLGQWQSLNYGSAVATFRGLQRRLPTASAGFAGEADAQLRLAQGNDGDGRRFEARNRYRRALALYRRARTLDRDPGLLAGEARALAGLGEHARAARLAEQAARALGRPAEVEQHVVEDLERAHAYGAAADAATRLAADPRFPHAPALIFTVTNAEAERLSLGAGRLTPAQFEIRPLGERHGELNTTVESLPFLPVYRPDELTHHEPRCAAFSARRDRILAERPRDALAGLPEAFATIDGKPCGDAVLLAAVAMAEAGDAAGAAARLSRARDVGEDRAAAIIAERRQNLWRFAGRYDRAAAIADSFMAEFPASVRAFEVAGEIAYLRGRHDEAARRFNSAASLARGRYGGWSATEATNLLRRGAVLRFAGRREESVRTLLAADEVATRAIAAPSSREPAWAQEPPSGTPPEDLAAAARAQAGDTYLRLGRFADADEQYTASEALGQRAGYDPDPAVANNQAVAKLHLGQPAAAVALSRSALRSDPRSPLYLETLSGAFAKAGDHRRAAATAWKALRGDPTLLHAWNDLGVALARTGRKDEAISAFRRALGIRRGYALAWFNLGVTLEDSGPRHFATAQGAFARAARYDTRLADRKHALVLDDRVYVSGLDVSKPIPAKWSFADTQTKWPVPAAGLALALLLGVQLTRAAPGRGLPGGTQRWLEAARGLLSRLPRILVGLGSGAVAVAITVAVLVWPAVHAGDRSFATLAPLLTGLLLLIVMIIRVRVLAARAAGVSLRQRSWRPALLVALAGAALGAPLAPLPVAETDKPAPLIHQGGPLVAAAIGLILASLGAWLGVPATQALATAAIVMAASMLVPVAPLDGARLGGGGATAAGFGIVGVAILALVGLG